MGLFARVAGRFGRVEPRRPARAHLTGLLVPVERENGWRVAEAAGDATPDKMQRLLNAARAVLSVALLAAILGLPASLPAAGALPGPVTGWHVDFLVYSTLGPGDAAAAARWDSTGTLTAFEVDVEGGQVDLQYVANNGDFGAFAIGTHLADGRVHRIHLDAAQAGPDVVVTMTIGGWLAYPFLLPGQQIGSLRHAVANPTQPIRTANATVSVADLTVWSA
jgi:hypothetical protein